MTHPYSEQAPSRAELDSQPADLIIEFGANSCGHCQAAQAAISSALAAYPQLRHLKIADGPGRPLGRSFRVKLWPTLIVLQNGQEIARVVRPSQASDISEALAKLLPGTAGE